MITSHWIAGRADSRVRFLGQCREAGRLFPQGRRGARIANDGRSLGLHELPAPLGALIRCTRVLGDALQGVGAEGVACRGARFLEPRCLVLLAASTTLGSPAEIVSQYGKWRRIGPGFRDFKTGLGLGGVQL